MASITHRRRAVLRELLLSFCSEISNLASTSSGMRITIGVTLFRGERVLADEVSDAQCFRIWISRLKKGTEPKMIAVVTKNGSSIPHLFIQPLLGANHSFPSLGGTPDNHRVGGGTRNCL